MYWRPVASGGAGPHPPPVFGKSVSNPISIGEGTVLRFEVKVAVLWSISKIETQNYDFFESYVFPYASLCLKYYLDWIFDYFLLD